MTEDSRPFLGKVVLVTGGARDIGAATVRAFAERGAAVVINYQSSADKANTLAAEITAAGGKAIAVKADVTDAAQIAAMLDAARTAFGANVDVLVNNAGGLVARKTMAAMDVAFWREVLDLNLTSVFLVTKAVLEVMPDGGTIVNVASLAARDGGGGGALAYSASKGAVLTMTRGLSKELAGRQIRVNCVTPGMIDTTFHDTFTPPEVRKVVASRTSVGREGTSADVASSIVFLASSESAYLNGASLEINGGLYFS